MRRIAFAVSFFALASQLSFAASLEKALMMRNHGLTAEAKSELIEVIFGTSADSTKAQAYYELGIIAFDQKNVNAALETWRALLEKYPTSKEAKLVEGRIQELAEMLGEISKAGAEDAVAQAYLGHGDFWSNGKDEIFKIDSSWIPKVEAAVKWYDKVIAEYPKTHASRLAYEGKIRTLLGWKEPGQYGSTFGVEQNFRVYIPQVLAAFAAFEAEHPEASSLQGFRYQIAQSYWANKDWAKTREWLNLVIQKSGEKTSFYKDLAERRLQKVEY